MKHIKLFFPLITYMIVIFTTLSCSTNPEELAKVLLNEINVAYQSNDENLSLRLIDSLHSTYPKCITQRRQADTIEWNIELKQMDRSMPYLDSMLISNQETFPTLKKNFRFEKDDKYQDVGEFVHSLLTTERNTNRCYLKPYTNEKGDFLIMSYYVGKQTTHNMLTAHIGEMTVSTLIVEDEDIHAYTDLDVFHETIIFSPEQSNTLPEFIANNSGNDIKIILSLNGDKNKYIYNLNKTERQIFDDTYQLSIVIKDINNIIEQQNKIHKRQEIINRKLIR